jgi:molybdopterin-containing oxidoreductase family membrane subunit
MTETEWCARDETIFDPQSSILGLLTMAQAKTIPESMPRITYSQVNRDILRAMEPAGMKYYLLLAFDLVVLVWGGYCWSVMLQQGLGVAGFTNTVRWVTFIVNFVFWVGIAHSGTLISAVLFLFRARWRTAVARSAEAMTVFAVMTAGLFPIIHLGRAWYAYWLFPYPNERQLWVNFRSPLVWDVFAVSTYFTISAVFWYVGLVPDIAAARDRAHGLRRKIYGILSLGWRGRGDQWVHFSSAYLFFAALATPLVISVHSVVSWDFAMGLVPGWHSTIFAPYFVAGAIFSGLAMVITLLVPVRKIFGLEPYITVRHFESLAKMILFTSMIVTYAYFNEFFIAWYSGNPFEQSAFRFRAFGSYTFQFWLMITCNSIIPLLLWFKSIRANISLLFVISIFVNIGMWLERFVIVVGSLSHDFNPWSWGIYRPTWVELGIMAGSFAWFFLWFLLFVKVLPAVSIMEVKEALHPPLKKEAGTA